MGLSLGAADLEGDGLLTSQTRAISAFPVLLVNFIGSLGFSLVMPFLIFLVTRFGGNAVIYGLLGATYPALQLVGAPLLGKWSDRLGRRPVLLLSQAGTLVSWVIFLVALFVPVTELFSSDTELFGAFALTVPLLIMFLARALDGLTGGNISVANAYMADITPEDERSAAFGRMSVASNLGFIFGPAIAGVLGSTALGETLPVLAALMISLLATFIVGFYLPESKSCVLGHQPHGRNVHKVFGQEHRECIAPSDDEPVTFRAVLGLPHIPFILILYFLIFVGFNLFYTAFPVHAAAGLEWEMTQIGVYFSFLGLSMAVVQGPVLSRLSKHVSEPLLIVLGNVVLAVNFALLTSESTIVLYAAAVLFAIGNGVMWPSVLAVLSRLAGDEYQGSVQGFAGSVGSLASIVGLIAGGLLYDAIGVGTFLASAGILALSAVLALPLFKVVRRPATAPTD